MIWVLIIGAIWLAAGALVVACFHAIDKPEPLPPAWVNQRPKHPHHGRVRRCAWHEDCRR